MTTTKKPLATLLAFLATNPDSKTGTASLSKAIVAFAQGYQSTVFQKVTVTLEQPAKIEIHDAGIELGSWLEGELDVLRCYGNIDVYGNPTWRFISKVGSLLLTVTYTKPYCESADPSTLECLVTIEYERIDNPGKLNGAARRQVAILDGEVASRYVESIPEALPIAVLAGALIMRFDRKLIKALVRSSAKIRALFGSK